MHFFASLIQLFAPWQALYSDSKIVAGTVTATHLLALLFGGGLAVAADRATLRALSKHADDRLHALQNIRTTHRPVLIALIVLFISGFALAAADLETFLGSWIFWVKLGLVALLLLNGFFLERTETRLRFSPVSGDARLWRRLRTTAAMSIALWSATLVAGTLLVNA
jgi:uncharacterized membrane protein